MSRDEFINPQIEKQEADSYSVKDLLMEKDYIIKRILKRHGFFMIFLLLLSMFYIWNSYRYESENRRLKSVKKEVDVLRFKSMEVQSELGRFSRQSQVLEKIKSMQLGLELSSEPPVVLKIEEK